MIGVGVEGAATGLPAVHVLDADIAYAADEALTNAWRMYLAGYATEAVEVAQALRGPGPWQISQHGALFRRLTTLLPQLCWGSGRDCPADGDAPARTMQELQGWAQERLENLRCRDSKVCPECDVR
jgi:hypothetical protein